MFGFLSQYRSILVTGPQRSGTRICAKMISQGTGYEYLDERLAGPLGGSLIYATRQLERDNVVLQAPGVSHVCHEMPKDVLVVMMMRNIDDIIRSQERLGWECEHIELSKYLLKPWEGPIAAIKYIVWEEQKKSIKSWLEIEYEDLCCHPLWVSDRKGWEWNQTEKNETIP